MSLSTMFMKTVGMPLASRLASRRFWNEYRAMMRFEADTAEARATLHERRLTDILNHATEHVPLWERHAADIKNVPTAGERLRMLPVTNKAVYKRGYPTQTTRRGERTGWRFLSSSGTVDRLTVVTDLQKRDRLAASLLRVNRCTTGDDIGVLNVEIPPQCCNVMCQLPEVREGMSDLVRHMAISLKAGTIRSPETIAKLRGCFRQMVLPRSVLLPINPLPRPELDAVLDDRIRQIQKAKPRVMRALPVYLLWLARRLREKQETLPSLRVVLPWGGLMTPSMISRVTDVIDSPFRDIYGATELGEIAISCPHGTLHVNDDLYEVEILDAHGHAVPPGTRGRITVTDFSNYAMPMIRYQVGDIGLAPPLPCECGKVGPQLVVCGRGEETIYDRNNEPRVTAYDLLELFFSDTNIMNFRVDETASGRYTATIVTDTTGSTDTGMLASSLQSLLECDEPPAIRDADFIRPEESGKYRFLHPLTARQRPTTAP